jgi:hypothetical protein
MGEIGSSLRWSGGVFGITLTLPLIIITMSVMALQKIVTHEGPKATRQSGAASHNTGLPRFARNDGIGSMQGYHILNPIKEPPSHDD